MKSLSAILVVVYLYLTQSAYSRSIKAGESCLAAESQCDETKCILKQQVCDGTSDCNDKTDEIGCDCLHKGLISCGVEGKCFDQKHFCSGAPCSYMKGNATCDVDSAGSAVNVSESPSKAMKNETTIASNKMDMNESNVTRANMSIEFPQDNTTAMDAAKTNITLDASKVNMTNAAENISKNNTIMDNSTTSMKNVSTIDELTMDNSTAAMKNVSTIDETIIPRDNMTVSKSENTDSLNDTDHSSWMPKSNITDNMLNETEEMMLDALHVTTLEINDALLTTEISVDESNVTDENDDVDVAAGCAIQHMIPCEEFGPPCITPIDYCYNSSLCPSQNRSLHCGEDGLPIREPKMHVGAPSMKDINETLQNAPSKLSNLIHHHESDSKNFLNSTEEAEADELATKESLKVTESESKGDNHLKIIIPVVVIGGLCIIVLLIWFVTKRSKKVDSYALQ